MEHLQTYTPYHIHNLETIAIFLESAEIPPPKFEMSSYMEVQDWAKLPEGLDIVSLSQHGFHYKSTSWAIPEIYKHCGTSACAVGHGPLAGIPALPGETWVQYSIRVFGCGQGEGDNEWINSKDFDFMFGPSWSGLNNTAKGTARRIKYWLANGRGDYDPYDEVYPWLEDLSVEA